MCHSQAAARRGDRLVPAEPARLAWPQLSGEAVRQQGTRRPRAAGRRREGGHRTERVADDRGLWCRAASDALRSGAPAIGVHGGGERRPGHAEVAGHQGLGARRREVLPGEAGEHWVLGLSG